MAVRNSQLCTVYFRVDNRKLISHAKKKMYTNTNYIVSQKNFKIVISSL